MIAFGTPSVRLRRTRLKYDGTSCRVISILSITTPRYRPCCTSVPGKAGRGAHRSCSDSVMRPGTFAEAGTFGSEICVAFCGGAQQISRPRALRVELIALILVVLVLVVLVAAVP